MSGPEKVAHPVNIKVVEGNNLSTLLENIDEYVILDFWAPWCAPCRSLNPHIYKLAENIVGKATVLKVNVDVNKAIVAEYDIRTIPTLLVLDKNREVRKRIVGHSLTLEKDIIEILDEQGGKAPSHQ